MLPALRAYIRDLQLLRAGDRLAIAVSGGADSVALLRAMLELRDELGLVLSVAHFHHQIRSEADEDQRFVEALANRYGLEFHFSTADVPAFAASQHLTLEAAGRQLRYSWMRQLIAENKVDKVATGHTLDDQAETVLFRFIRGAGTRGFAGIHPAIIDNGRTLVIRPLLNTSRSEVAGYLHSINQDWREDSTNSDRAYSRNRLRHDLLPVIESQFNPAIKRVLSETAEIARAEEDYWNTQVSLHLPGLFADNHLDTSKLAAHPLAFQRRLLRAAAESVGITLEFQHVDELLQLALADGSSGQLIDRQLSLPGDWCAICSRGTICFEPSSKTGEPPPFEAPLSVPGEIHISCIASTFRASSLSVNPDEASYNPAAVLDARKLAPQLLVRNWRAGDRFWPLHTSRPEKLKRLLQDKKVPAAQRASWPVILSGENIVWVRGFPVASDFAVLEPGQAIKIDELRD